MSLNILPWRSLKTRVTLLTLVIFLISVWSLAFYVSRTSREDMQRVLGEQQFLTVSLLAAQIDHDLSDHLKALETVAGSITPAILETPVALQTLLRQRPVLRELFSDGIFITGLDGLALASISPDGKSADIGFMGKDFIAAALDGGKAAISRPLIGKKQLAPVLAVTAAIRDAQGAVIGALTGVVSLNESSFLAKVTEGRYGKTGGYLLIAPQHSLFVTASDKTRVMQPIPGPGINPMLDKYMQGYEGYGLALSSRGVEELSAAKGIPLAGWFLVIALPTAEAFASINVMQQHMLLAMIFLSLLVGCLTWWMTSWMLHRQLSPMIDVAKMLTSWSDADRYPQPLPIPRQDEIGELIGSFNRLLATLGQREALLRQVLDTSSVAIFLVNMEGRITQANQRMAEMFGLPLDALEGREYISLVHPEERETGRQKMLALLGSDIASVDLDRLYWRADQSQFWGHLSGRRFYEDSGEENGLVGVIADITERRQATQYEQFRSHTLELLAGDEPLGKILEAIVRGVEQLNPAMLCSIVLLDSNGRRLGKSTAPSLPDFYNATLEGVEIGVGVGSCGTAAFTGQRVIVEDIKTHPYWAPYIELAARAGLGACWSQPILSSSGRVLGTFAIYHRDAHSPVESDIFIIEQSARLACIVIEHKRAAEKLQLAANVFTHAREGILITDVDGRIIEVNEAFSRITGYRRDEALGQNPSFLSSGRHDQEFYRALWRDLAEKDHWYGEIWNRRKNGEVYAEMKTISAVRDTEGSIRQYVALFSDITALKEHEKQLEHIAHYDVLTTLPNRVLFADRLRQAMAQAQRRRQPLAVVYLDLDGFKAVNDRHGHESGDQLLMTVATRMKLVLREGDTLARLGGDEFVAVLLDLEDVAASVLMLGRLLSAAALPVDIGGYVLQVSASAGVTFFPQKEDVDADQLLRQADQAMYQAKLAGKNRYHVFDAVQDSSVRGHHESLEHIRHALARREFVLYYQPKVNMRTGAVIGAEALIRWQHPERGLLPPAVFLPVIEDHPLAIEVGEWVIDSALKQMTAWQVLGLDIQVSVNVGARQLQQTDFVGRLREILAAHPNVKPSDLQLEVLETSALDDLAGVSLVIEGCRAIGVTFALDDFGTGYSSLTYLKRLSVTQLKIDQSFVRDMLDDPDDLAILEGVLGLAAAFRRQVIAEGVESVEHGEMLLQLGCELAQGYGIARPMPAHELPGWAARWQPDPAWAGLSSLSRDELPLLFACAEHRVWIAAMEEFLRSERGAAPPLDYHKCRFGQWLYTEGQARYDARPGFQEMVLAHRQVHALAIELSALHAAGQRADALARLGELYGLRDALLAQLKALVRLHG